MIKQRCLDLSPDAIRDLINIYDFIAQTNPPAARRLINSIETKLKKAAREGNAGVARDWIRPGLRALPFKDRCAYFRIDESTLYVLRIVHGRQSIRPEEFEMEDIR